jgi:hypothetical protein
MALRGRADGGCAISRWQHHSRPAHLARHDLALPHRFLRELLATAILGIAHADTSASAAAVSIGFINMSANLAGYFGNHNVGWLKAHGFADRACLLFLAGCYLLGGAFVPACACERRAIGDRGLCRAPPSR